MFSRDNCRSEADNDYGTIASGTLINEPVVHTTGEAACNFQIDEQILRPSM